MAGAFEVIAPRLRQSLNAIARHVQRRLFALPLVIVVGDGQLGDASSAVLYAADQLKAFQVDGVGVEVATVGVKEPNEAFLRQLASDPHLYFPINDWVYVGFHCQISRRLFLNRG